MTAVACIEFLPDIAQWCAVEHDENGHRIRSVGGKTFFDKRWKLATQLRRNGNIVLGDGTIRRRKLELPS